MNLSQWLEKIEQLHPKNIDMGLSRVREVARRMELAFDCPVITVAGTNGKGSTCAMLDAIYTQAGYKTGVYSSPHLVHFEERCRLMGEPVDAGVLVAAFERVEVARLLAPELSLSYFEYTTLAMLDIMSQSGLDVAILEVGLGGRLDAVNVIDTDCAIITSIDIDHVEYLGPDRESIGFEKAGIMRAGKPAIVGDPMAPKSAWAWTLISAATSSSGAGQGAMRAQLQALMVHKMAQYNPPSAPAATPVWLTPPCAAQTNCSTPAAYSQRSLPCASACP